MDVTSETKVSANSGWGHAPLGPLGPGWLHLPSLRSRQGDWSDRSCCWTNEASEKEKPRSRKVLAYLAGEANR